MPKTSGKMLVGLLFVIFDVAARLLPHPPNVAPIAATALFGGVHLGLSYGLILPLSAMFLSDWLIGFYDPRVMFAVYGSFVLIGLVSQWVKKHKRAETVVAASLAASLIFFIITNWAVWQFGSLYPRSFAGLLECFAAALPFFQNTLFGDLVYTSLFFGAYELIASIKKSSFKLLQSV